MPSAGQLLLIPSGAVDSSNHRAIRWLRAELPELVAGGIITPESASAIDRHYPAAEARSSNFGFAILAVIGSALVGAGIVLLIAHNWDDLSRPARCLLAFLPLIIAQVLCFFVLLRRNHSAAWRESAAIFNVAAVATAISLVSQTYQIQGSFADFMRIWLLLSIPVVYLFRTSFGALVYILGTAVWAVSKAEWWSHQSGQMFFWFLLLLIIPFYGAIIRKGRSGWAFRMLSFALVAVGAIGLGFTVDFARINTGAVAFAGFFALVYLIGMRWHEEVNEALNTLAILGGLGIATTAVVLSFEAVWHFRADSFWSQRSGEQQLAIVIALAFPAAAIALAAWSFTRGRILYCISAACIPIVAIFARVIASFGPEAAKFSDHPSAFLAAIVFNVYTLVLGVELIVRGIRAGSMARANFGLLVVAALACARFFDSDLSFVVRGIGFIAVGAGFLFANAMFFRKRVRA